MHKVRFSIPVMSLEIVLIIINNLKIFQKKIFLKESGYIDEFCFISNVL